MKKNGFTLAEILITLGIIGVVAALTAPGLILRSTQNANGAKLATMVANIENALTGAIASEGVDGLDELNDWTPAENTKNFVSNIGKYLHISGVGVAEAGNAYSAGSTYYNDYSNILASNNGAINATNQGIFDNAVPILTKSGCALFINKEDVLGNENDIRQAGGSLIRKAANVVIDVNGQEEPNQLGTDIFGFYLSNDGILYPIGGTDVSTFESHKANVNGQAQPAITYSQGLERTATLVQNGYKFNY